MVSHGSGVLAQLAIPVNLENLKLARHEVVSDDPPPAARSPRTAPPAGCWGNGYDHALGTAAKADGYEVALAGKAREVTPEQAAAKLLQLDDATLSALGLTRKPAKGGKK
jgi:hypothetical protein